MPWISGDTKRKCLTSTRTAKSILQGEIHAVFQFWVNISAKIRACPGHLYRSLCLDTNGCMIVSGTGGVFWPAKAKNENRGLYYNFWDPCTDDLWSYWIPSSSNLLHSASRPQHLRPTCISRGHLTLWTAAARGGPILQEQGAIDYSASQHDVSSIHHFP